MKMHVLVLSLMTALLLAGCRTGEVAAAPVTRAPSEAAPGATTAAAITPEEAQGIALTHAGFTADQVSRLYVEYQLDRGVPEYDVEFREGRWEYDYEIHAETGEILSFERDD